MVMPKEPVHLTVEQIAELQGKLATLRHDINNRLAVLMAVGELGRLQPAMIEQLLKTLVEQPRLIAQDLTRFSLEFEQSLGLAPS